jgi:hypothetical protein
MSNELVSIDYKEYRYSSFYREMEELQQEWITRWADFNDFLEEEDYKTCLEIRGEMNEIDNDAAVTIEKIENYLKKGGKQNV